MESRNWIRDFEFLHDFELIFEISLNSFSFINLYAMCVSIRAAVFQVNIKILEISILKWQYSVKLDFVNTNTGNLSFFFQVKGTNFCDQKVLSHLIL